MSHKSILIIQVGKRSLTVSEYKKENSGIVSQTAELPLENGQSVTLTGVGEKLKKLLEEKQIRTKATILIPYSADILVRSMSIPPLSDMSMLKGIVYSRLQKELKLSSVDIALDYSGTISSQEQSDIMLAGLLRKKIVAMTAMLDDAQLSLTAVVPDFVCLFQAHITGKTNKNLIFVENESVKIILAENGGIKHLATVSLPDTNPEAMAFRIMAELERNVATSSERCDNFTVITQDKGLVSALQKLAGTKRSFSVDTSIINCSAGIGALCLSDREFELDFTNDHFSEKKTNKLSDNMRKIVIACVGLLFLVGWFFFDWSMDKREIDNANLMIKGTQATVDEAQAIIGKMALAQKWCSTDPVYSKCLLQITTAFPDNSNIIANSLVLDESFVGVMTGTSSNKGYVSETMKSLIQNKYFSDVKTLYVRQSGKSTSEQDFALQFKYNVDGVQPKPVEGETVAAQ